MSVLLRKSNLLGEARVVRVDARGAGCLSLMLRETRLLPAVIFSIAAIQQA